MNKIIFPTKAGVLVRTIRALKPFWWMLGIGLFVILLYFAWQGFNSWRTLRDFANYEIEIKQLQDEANRYKAIADAKAAEVARKDAELIEANNRVQQAEVALVTATRNRQRAQVNYEQARARPVDRAVPAPSIDELCKQLESLGKPCRE